MAREEMAGESFFFSSLPKWAFDNNTSLNPWRRGGERRMMSARQVSVVGCATF